MLFHCHLLQTSLTEKRIILVYMEHSRIFLCFCYVEVIFLPNYSKQIHFNCKLQFSFFVSDL